MSSMGHQGRERTKNSNKFSFRLPPLVYHQPWDRSTQIKKAPGTFHRSSLSGNSSLSSGPRYTSSYWLGTRTRKMMNYSGLLQLLSTITRRRRVTWTMMREVVSTTREGEQIWRQRAVSTRPCNLPPSSCIIAAERPPLWQGQKERTSSWIPIEVTSAIESLVGNWLMTWKESFLTTTLACGRNQIAHQDSLRGIERSKPSFSLQILPSRSGVQGYT